MINLDYSGLICAVNAEKWRQMLETDVCNWTDVGQM